MTTSTLTRLAPTQVELEIPIEPGELVAAEERAFRKLVKNVRMPGFRRGKIPRKVFEQAYGAETIQSQALEDVVPELFAKAVREHDLEPVERPHMEMLPDGDGATKRVKATVAVRPAIELKTYRGLELPKPDDGVSDEDVERSLQALARERATLVPVDRVAKIGDVVTMDFAGAIDGTPFEGGTATGQQAELDESRFIPGFATGIAGMRAGESKDVEAHFPEDYQQSDLAGKTAVFAVTLHDVKEYELPALDDAFAASVSENGTLDELRADVRRRLETIAKQRSRREIGNSAIEKLVAEHDFPLPEPLVEREVDRMLNDASGSAARMGVSFEDYLSAVGKTEEELRAQFAEEARSRVKATLLLEEIAKAEKIVATPADVQAELESLARQYGQPVDRIRGALGGNLLYVMDGIVRNKTVDFLIDNAKTA